MSPQPEYEVLFYREKDRNSPVEEFLEGLPAKVQGKVYKWFQLLEEEGPRLPRPYADVLRDKIRELRLRFGENHYRFLYFFWGKKIVITQGFVKKTDEVPESEIDRAVRRRNDFMQGTEGGGFQS
ncbi:MAG: type II toxin-antitoxin system RelE/ParE family toxin [Candidatus Omnitrophica bacterium]|nr:type II toxin-antitoxin system RelE/ParE family toxin [Candidatus Omnitrophota bacterium]